MIPWLRIKSKHRLLLLLINLRAVFLHSRLQNNHLETKTILICMFLSYFLISFRLSWKRFIRNKVQLKIINNAHRNLKRFTLEIITKTLTTQILCLQNVFLASRSVRFLHERETLPSWQETSLTLNPFTSFSSLFHQKLPLDFPQEKPPQNIYNIWTKIKFKTFYLLLLVYCLNSASISIFQIYPSNSSKFSSENSCLVDTFPNVSSHSH